MPEEDATDNYLQARLQVTRDLQRERAEGKTDLLIEVLAHSGPVPRAVLDLAQHAARWRDYWELRVLAQAGVASKAEVGEAWTDCLGYYGEAPANEKRAEVSERLSSGIDWDVAVATVPAPQRPIPRRKGMKWKSVIREIRFADSAASAFDASKEAMATIGKVKRADKESRTIEGNARHVLQKVHLTVDVFPAGEASTVRVVAHGDDARGVGAQKVLDRFLEILSAGVRD